VQRALDGQRVLQAQPGVCYFAGDAHSVVEVDGGEEPRVGAGVTVLPGQVIGHQRGESWRVDEAAEEPVEGAGVLEVVVGEVPVDAAGEERGRGGKISADQARALCGKTARSASTAMGRPARSETRSTIPGCCEFLL